MADTCPACKRPLQKNTSLCIYCGAIVPVEPATSQASTPQPPPATPQADMTPELVQAVLEENKRKADRFRRWRRWEHLFLILALPVLVPSLMINYVMASRWGRVDFVLINMDAVVLLLLAARSPVFLPVMIVAWIASVMLWGIRRNQLAGGIFLGYSNTVATALIFGGFFLFGALIALVSFDVHGWKPWMALLIGLGFSGFGIRIAWDE